MGSKIEYVDSTHMYATNYVRNSKAIGVLWAIFTICYAIIGAVSFLTPEWIGDAALESESPGRLGVWQACRADEAGGERCEGRLDDWSSLPGFAFRIATALVGLAVALALFTICAMLLFFFCRSTTVFHICGWLHLLSDKEDCPNVCADSGGFKKVRFEDVKDGANGRSLEEQPARGSGDAPAQDSEPADPNWLDHLGDRTGTRPVVDKYSISRFSLGEWRKHNEDVLDQEALNRSNVGEYNARTAMMRTFGTADKMQDDNKKKLKQKAADIFRWKVEVERSIKNISEEVVLLEEERQRLKGAGKVLMLPESISTECIELRTNRFDTDLVSDQAEQELIVEMKLVDKVRESFNKALMEVEQQLAINKSVKQRIEFDWSNKKVAYETETLNISLENTTKILQFQPGAVRFGDPSTSIEYWEYFCRDTVEQCEAVRQKSSDLRGTLNAILVNGGRDLRNQADKTDMAFAETTALTEELCTKLEQNLLNVLQRIADTEILIDELKDAVRKMDAGMKLAQTRLNNRNCGRPNLENCRDVPQYGLIDEVKKIHENVTSLLGEIRSTEATRSALMDKRRALEKEIAAKRKTLSIDRDRCGMVRSHYPSASQLAGH